MGYRNPVLTLRFDDLVEDGDACFVVIRNPRTMPTAELQSSAGKVTEADRERFAAAKAAVDAGGEIPAELVEPEDENRGFAIMAKLIIGWRVWDPTVPVKVDMETGDLIRDAETEPRLLPLPATTELIGRLPPGIIQALTEELNKTNPQASPAESTSNPS